MARKLFVYTLHETFNTVDHWSGEGSLEITPGFFGLSNDWEVVSVTSAPPAAWINATPNPHATSGMAVYHTQVFIIFELKPPVQ